jgi:ATP-binding protein involved in chromosome partitioning
MSTCDPKSCGSCPSKDSKSEDKDQLLQCKLARIKNKIIVMSGKGGVGKSSVAVYIALALAQQGHQVGLMDVDLHGPSVPRMLGLHGLLGFTTDDQIIPHAYRPNLKVVSVESMLEDADSAVIWRGPLKHGVIQQFITNCRWDDLDFLVVDCPPGTGDEPLSVAKLIPDARAIIVTTPQEVALADVRKSINFCRKVKLEIVGLVENMSGLFCPHCQGFIPIFRQGGGQKTAELMKVELLGALPFDPAVVESGDRGRPVLEDDRDTPFRSAVLKLTAAILQRLEAIELNTKSSAALIH